MKKLLFLIFLFPWSLYGADNQAQATPESSQKRKMKSLTPCLHFENEQLQTGKKRRRRATATTKEVSHDVTEHIKYLHTRKMSIKKIADKVTKKIKAAKLPDTSQSINTATVIKVLRQNNILANGQLEYSCINNDTAIQQYIFKHITSQTPEEISTQLASRYPSAAGNLRVELIIKWVEQETSYKLAKDGKFFIAKTCHKKPSCTPIQIQEEKTAALALLSLALDC